MVGRTREDALDRKFECAAISARPFRNKEKFMSFQIFSLKSKFPLLLQLYPASRQRSDAG